MATPDRFALPQLAESTRKPEWLKVRMPHGREYERVRDIVRKTGLATVCEEARCPNIAECWGGGTATVMLMGEVCTRACRFCHVKVGAPPPLDPEEPENLARAVRELGLEYIVVTSVNRDDRPDGGASHFAAAIRALKRESPRTTVEVLIPDFKGVERDLDEAGVDVLTLGQYLQPSQYHLRVARFVPPADFDRYKQVAEGMGFLYVAAGPLVRSSYRAAEFFMKGLMEQGRHA